MIILTNYLTSIHACSPSALKTENIRNNQTARQIVFDSKYFEIGILRPKRRNERFQERSIIKSTKSATSGYFV